MHTRWARFAERAFWGLFENVRLGIRTLFMRSQLVVPVAAPRRIGHAAPVVAPRNLVLVLSPMRHRGPPCSALATWHPTDQTICFPAPTEEQKRLPVPFGSRQRPTLRTVMKFTTPIFTTTALTTETERVATRDDSASVTSASEEVLARAIGAAGLIFGAVGTEFAVTARRLALV